MKYVILIAIAVVLFGAQVNASDLLPCRSPYFLSLEELGQIQEINERLVNENIPKNTTIWSRVLTVKGGAQEVNSLLELGMEGDVYAREFQKNRYWLQHKVLIGNNITVKRLSIDAGVAIAMNAIFRKMLARVHYNKQSSLSGGGQIYQCFILGRGYMEGVIPIYSSERDREVEMLTHLAFFASWMVDTQGNNSEAKMSFYKMLHKLDPNWEAAGERQSQP
jgi:hypothetical protein